MLEMLITCLFYSVRYMNVYREVVVEGHSKVTSLTVNCVHFKLHKVRVLLRYFSLEAAPSISLSELCPGLPRRLKHTAIPRMRIDLPSVPGAPPSIP